MQKLKQQLISFWSKSFSHFWGFLFFVFTTVSLTSLFVWLTSSPSVIKLFGYKEVVDFGTAAGAVSALVIGVVSSYLIFVSFQVQIRFNEDQRQMLNQQREDFEVEKKRAKVYEDYQIIDREIQYFQSEINNFSYNGLQGSEAIYNCFIMPLRKIRHLSYSIFYIKEKKRNILNRLPYDQLVEILYSTKLEQIKALEKWNDLKNQIKDWGVIEKYLGFTWEGRSDTKNNKFNYKELSICDLDDAASVMISTKHGWPGFHAYELIGEIDSIDDNKIIALLGDEFEFYERMDTSFIDKISEDDRLTRFDIDPAELIYYGQEGHETLKDDCTELVKQFRLNHFLYNKLRGFFARAESVIRKIQKSNLSHNEMIETQTNFEELFFSSLSKEFFIIDSLDFSEYDKLPYYVELCLPLKKLLISKFDVYERFVKSKVYEPNSVYMTDLGLSGHWLLEPHTKHSFLFLTQVDEELLCGYPNANRILSESIKHFINSIQEKKEFTKDLIGHLAFLKMRDGYSIKKEEMNIDVFSLIERLNQIEYTSNIRFSQLQKLMTFFRKSLKEFEKSHNKPFSDIDAIKPLNLKFDTQIQV